MSGAGKLGGAVEILRVGIGLGAGFRLGLAILVIWAAFGRGGEVGAGNENCKFELVSSFPGILSLQLFGRTRDNLYIPCL